MMRDHLYTLPEKLTEIVKQNPNKVALQLKTAKGYKKYTYQQFYQSTQFIAQGLAAFGIKKADKIAIILENRPEWGFIYFAIAFCGAIAVPIDPQTSEEDIEYFINQSQSKIIFTSQQFLDIFNHLDFTDLSGIVVLDIEGNIRGQQCNKKLATKIISYSEVLEPRSPQKLPQIALDDIASILYTSGTTGKPKGVMLSHKNFYVNFQSANKLGLIKNDDNVLAILPLHHSFPFMVTLLLPLFTQNCIIYVPDIKPETLLTALREAKITIFVLVPQILNMIAKQINTEIHKVLFLLRWPLLGIIDIFWIIRKLSTLNLNKLLLTKIHSVFGPRLRFLVCGGAKLNYDTAKFFSKLGFTVLQGYGLTETAPVVTFNSSGINKLESVGRPIPDVEVKIVDVDAQGIGEVVIKGPNVMLGYYKNEAATHEVIRDGWFYSGDLGYIDKRGDLYLTGRKKELIVLSSGKNITPEEIEAHYVKSSYIKELCVMPLRALEEEKLVAVIVPDLDYFRQKEIVNLYGMLQWDLENLSKSYPAYKRIMGFVIAKHDLPRTRLGKLKRYAIEDEYSPEFTGIKTQKEKDIISDEDLKIYTSKTTTRILSIISRELSLKKPAQLADHLEIDLGLDSLRRIELLAALENGLNITIPSTLIAKVFTVRELVLELERLVAKQKPVAKKTTKRAAEGTLWREILQIEPSKELLKSISLHPSWPALLFAKSIAGFLRFIFRIIWRFKVIGKENLPKNEPFILCINHASYLDGLLIGTALPTWLIKDIFLVAYNTVFERPVIRYFVKLLKIIPVNQVVQLVDAMQVSAYVLRNGKALAFFPAGARSIDGTVQEFKKGVGILAKELNLQLVPVYINGSFEAWPRGRRFPRPHKITVTFGKALKAKDLKQQGMKLGAKDDYQAISLAIREAVIKLKD